MDKAHLMGKSSYAELNLMDQMAKKPENALKLLSQLATLRLHKLKKNQMIFRN
jgi:peptidyl-dipeptidase Dcp